VLVSFTWVPPLLLTKECRSETVHSSSGSLPGVEALSNEPDTHLYLVPTSRTSGAITPLPSMPS
jgi:hypothetical protein